jgi:RhoGAP domain/EF-hand domain pair
LFFFLEKDDFMGQVTIKLSEVANVGDHEAWHALGASSMSLKGDDVAVTGDLLFRFETRLRGLVPPTFGIDLEVVCKRDNVDVPCFLPDLLRFAQKKGVKEKGVFRVGGVQTEIAQLRSQIDAGGTVEWGERHATIHNATGLLKMYLRELPTPLLTFDLWRRVMAAGSLSPEESADSAKSMLAKLRHIVAVLPEANQSLLLELVSLLAEVARTDGNAMDARNLAIVVGPNLIWEQARKDDAMAAMSSSSAIETFSTFLIERYRDVFPRTALSLGVGGLDDRRLLRLSRSPSNAAILPGENNDDATASELGAEAYRLFATYDTDQSGSIDRGEFEVFYTEFLSSLGRKTPSKKRIEKAWKTIDEKRTGEVSWPEFTKWWRSLALDSPTASSSSSNNTD